MRASRKPTVLLLYNRPDPDRPRGAGLESDAGVLNALAAIRGALRRTGHTVTVAGVRDLPAAARALARARAEVVFNLVEGLRGQPHDFNCIPALCRAAGRRCTGSGTPALCLTLDKRRTKAVLRAAGLGVPDGAWVAPGDPPPGRLPRGALIVKPAAADGSEGIAPDAVVSAPGAGLRRALRRVHRLGHAALIERFIAGREFNVALLERRGRVVTLPLAEIDFGLFPPGRPHIVDYTLKWRPGSLRGIVSPRRIPAPVSPTLARRLRAVALKAWRACDCRQYARVDLRVDRAGRIFVLEVNTNPDLAPLAGYPACLRAAGIGFDAFIADLVADAPE